MPAPRLTALRAADRPWVEGACRRFLVDHLVRWCPIYGLDGSPAAIEARIDSLRLVERDVGRLLQAAEQYQDNLVAVARQGDDPVGAVWAEVGRHPFLGIAHGVLGWIQVDPEARRQGVGRQLVEAAKTWARERGLAHLELAVVADNPAALALYRSCGLVVVDHRMVGRL